MSSLRYTSWPLSLASVSSQTTVEECLTPTSLKSTYVIL